MAKKIQPVIIRRQRKYEADNDLEERGFEVISPLKRQNISLDPWIAKLRRIEE
ncbi:hypothetical protein [Peribacillus butanolivorans]|uniref:hypothetical protein n=1 Tax=Peribacillus butanolivorans TaxID=421767 RepID=UPI0035DE1C66